MLERSDHIQTELEPDRYIQQEHVAAEGVSVFTAGLNDYLAAQGRQKSKTSCETLGPDILSPYNAVMAFRGN